MVAERRGNRGPFDYCIYMISVISLGCFVTKVRPIDKSFHHGKIKLSHWASSAAISEHNKLLQYWKVEVFSKLDLMQMIGSKYAISHFDLRKSIANVSDTVV